MFDAASLADLLLFLAGGALLAALARWWRPEVSWRAAAGYVLLAAAFFAVPLATTEIQTATDIAYSRRPWSETVETEVVPKNDLLSDIPLQILPFRTLVRQRLLRGEVPLWANELAAGQPLLGNAQSAPFAPLPLMALPLPPVRGLTVAVAWQFVVALLLMHALMLRLGTGGAAAAFSSIAFAFSSYAVAWAYHPLAGVAAWIPGVLLGMVLLRQGGRGGFAGLAACATAMAVSGHPETVAHTALACIAVGLALAILPNREGEREGEASRSRWRFLAGLAAAAALTVCLAAPALLPVLEVLPSTLRSEILVRQPRAVHPPPFQPAALLPAVDPLVLGSPRDRNWRGSVNFNEQCTAYAGIAALGLALAGSIALRGRALAIVLGGAAALLAATGLPPLLDLLTALPLLGQGAHARLRLFWVLAVAVAAGLALDRTGQRRTALAAAAGVAAAGVALALVPPPEVLWQRAWWGTALAAAGATAAALLVPAARRWAPRVAVAGLVIELFVLGIRFHPVLPPELGLGAPPALAWIVERQEEASRNARPFRILAELYDVVPNTAALFGLWDPRGNDPMQPADASWVVGRRLNPRHRLPRIAFQPPKPYDRAFHDYLAVRYFLAPHRRRLPPPWRPVFNHQGGKVWENPEAMPLFSFPRRTVREPERRKALREAVRLADFREVGIVEGGPAPGAQSGTVNLERLRANGFDLRVESLAGGVVVSSVGLAPGWRIAVGGKETPPLRVNGGFLGFAVPPGTHRAVVDYRPRGWTWGLWLLAVGVAGIAVVAARAYSPRRTSIGRR